VQGFQRRGCLPRIHAVQTAGAFPLKRAYDRLAARLIARLRADGLEPPASDVPAATAVFIRDHLSTTALDQELAWARHHRGHFMWPWETEPRSIAGGILDDETYDWAVVVEGMLRSGGYPVVVGEDQLIAANQLARTTTRVNVDHTGSAGLAGLLEVVALEPHVINEKAAVIFSGVSRPAGAA
jgi:threonine synthase